MQVSFKLIFFFKPSSAVYGTFCPPPEALCARPLALEGRVQLLRNVSELLGFSVNAACKAGEQQLVTDIHWFHAYSQEGGGGEGGGLTVSWRRGWAAGSLGSRPQWGKEGLLNRVSLDGPAGSK